MKRILITIALIGITTLTTDAQTMEKEYLNYLTQRKYKTQPKPESITFKGNKVIVVWNRKDWERMGYIGRKRVEGIRNSNRMYKTK